MAGSVERSIRPAKTTDKTGLVVGVARLAEKEEEEGNVILLTDPIDED